MLLTCAECRSQLRVPDLVAGKMVRCPKCSNTFRAGGSDTARPQLLDVIPADVSVPTVSAVSPPVMDDLDWAEPVEPLPPANVQRKPGPRPDRSYPTSREARRELDHEPERRRSEQAKSGSGLIIAVVLILMVTILGGGIGLYFLLRPETGELDWQEFTDQAGGFTVEFPGEPTRKQEIQDVGVGQRLSVTLAECRSGSAEFAVGYLDLPLEAIQRNPPLMILLDAETAFLEALNGRSINAGTSETPATTIHVRHFRAVIGTTTRHVVGRFYLVHRRLIMVVATDQQIDFDSPDAKRFFESFALLDRVPPVATKAAPPIRTEPVRPRPPDTPPQFPTHPFPSPTLPAPPPKANTVRLPPATEIDGCIAYWSLDEGKGEHATDGTDAKLRGKLENCQWTTGVRGKGLLLDERLKARFEYSTAAGLNFKEKDAFTFSLWVQTRMKQGTILSQRQGRDGGPVIDLFVQGGALAIDVRIDQREIDTPARPVGPGIADGQWHHIALCRDEAGELTLYIDGVLQKQPRKVACPGPITTDLRALGTELYWHARYGPGHPYFTGYVDEFAVFNRQLKSEEVRKLAGVPDKN